MATPPNHLFMMRPTPAFFAGFPPYTLPNFFSPSMQQPNFGLPHMFPNPQLSEMSHGLGPLVNNKAAFQQQLQAAMSLKAEASPRLKCEQSSTPDLKSIKSEPLKASDDEEDEEEQQLKAEQLEIKNPKDEEKLKSESQQQQQLEDDNELENDRVS